MVIFSKIKPNRTKTKKKVVFNDNVEEYVFSNDVDKKLIDGIQRFLPIYHKLDQNFTPLHI